MKPISFSLLATIALVAGFAPGAAAEGKTVDHTFSKAPLNAKGIKSLADLRGKPVVIDFWGKN